MWAIRLLRPSLHAVVEVAVAVVVVIVMCAGLVSAIFVPALGDIAQAGRSSTETYEMV